tara:strand:- start:222 stop:452 length:231 start_codon:yes stop_codon:yes gene_type:complete
MSRVEDPTVAQEIEELEERVRKLEQSVEGVRASSSEKNAEQQRSTYRVVKEEGKHFVEFKAKEGWIRSDPSTFSIR